MRKRKCKRCGKAYLTDRPDTYLCPECSAEVHKSAPVRQRICRQCGAPFTGGPRAWYCPNCRAERRRAQDLERKKNGTARLMGSTDVCVSCGKSYIVTSGRQKYCKNCAQKSVAETVRAQKREYYAENREALNARKAEMRSGRKICVICGSVFDCGTSTVTCSPECAKALRKQRWEEADIRRGKRKPPASAEPDLQGGNDLDAK